MEAEQIKMFVMRVRFRLRPSVAISSSRALWPDPVSVKSDCPSVPCQAFPAFMYVGMVPRCVRPSKRL